MGEFPEDFRNLLPIGAHLLSPMDLVLPLSFFPTLVKEKGIYPYVFAGGGVLYVDLGLPTMGSRLDFSYQGGTGIQYSLRRDLALTAEYRYHHISNAGTAAPNEPLNSSKFLFGISYFR